MASYLTHFFLRQVQLLLCLVCSLATMGVLEAEGANSTATAQIGGAATTDSVHLKEIVVQAAEFRREKDKLVVLPSKEALAIPADAIELIGNVNLPYIVLDKSTSKLEALKDGPIVYRINGVPVSIDDFRAVNPASIKKIDFYDTPGPRFGNASVVIDIITQRPQAGIGGLFNESMALNQGKGSFYNSLKLNYRRSEFTAYAHYEYARLADSHESASDRYRFDDGEDMLRTSTSAPFTFKEDFLNTFLSYSYMDKQNLFFAKCMYINYNTPETLSSSHISETTGDTRTEQQVEQRRNSSDRRPELNLYYQHKFGNGGLLMLDVMSSYMRVKSNDMQHYSGNGEDLSVSSLVSSRKASVISQVQYMQDFAKGTLSTGVKHTWHDSDADYGGSTDCHAAQARHDMSIFAEWGGNAGKFGYSAGVTERIISVRQNGETATATCLQPAVTLKYNATGRMTLSLSGRSSMEPSMLGLNSSIIVRKNPYDFTEGNPGLKPEKSYQTTVAAMYFSRGLSWSVDATYTHTDHPIMYDVVYSDGMFTTATMNGRRRRRLDLSGFARISLLGRRLSFVPRIGYTHNEYVCASYANRLNTWWFKGGVDYLAGHFNFSCDYYRNAKFLLYGINMQQTAQSIYLSASYNLNRFRATLSGSVPLDSYSVKRSSVCNLVDKHSTLSFADTGPMIMLRLSWSFSRNQTGRHEEKAIYNEDNDNGTL